MSEAGRGGSRLSPGVRFWKVLWNTKFFARKTTGRDKRGRFAEVRGHVIASEYTRTCYHQSPQECRLLLAGDLGRVDELYLEIVRTGYEPFSAEGNLHGATTGEVIHSAKRFV